MFKNVSMKDIHIAKLQHRMEVTKCMKPELRIVKPNEQMEHSSRKKLIEYAIGIALAIPLAVGAVIGFDYIVNEMVFPKVFPIIQERRVEKARERLEKLIELKKEKELQLHHVEPGLPKTKEEEIERERKAYESTLRELKQEIRWLEQEIENARRELSNNREILKELKEKGVRKFLEENDRNTKLILEEIKEEQKKSREKGEGIPDREMRKKLEEYNIRENIKTRAVPAGHPTHHLHKGNSHLIRNQRFL